MNNCEKDKYFDICVINPPFGAIRIPNESSTKNVKGITQQNVHL